MRPGSFKRSEIWSWEKKVLKIKTTAFLREPLSPPSMPLFLDSHCCNLSKVLQQGEHAIDKMNRHFVPSA